MLLNFAYTIVSNIKFILENHIYAVGFMYLDCVLRKFLWCLPCKLPYGKGHYATGCDLVLLSNVISIEQCLTNFSCNLLGCSPKKSPYVLNCHRKEK